MLITDDTFTLISSTAPTAGLYYHSPEVGERWIEHPNYLNKTFAVTTAGRVYADSGTGTSGYYVVPSPVGADYDVTAGIQVLSLIDQAPGVGGRVVKTANSMYLLRMLIGSGVLDLGVLINSVLTPLGSAPVTWAVGAYTITLRMRGDQISALLNGTEVIAPVTNTALTAPGVAMIRETRGGTNSAGQHFTSFRVEDFTAFDQTPAPAPVPAPDARAYIAQLYDRPVKPYEAVKLPTRVDGAMGINVDANSWIDSGVQYAVWTNELRNPIVGKRTLPDGAWSTADLSLVAGNPLVAPTLEDPHNTYVIAVSSDGHVHVMGNHHDVALRYVRTTTPGDITTFAAQSITGSGSSFTYPVFVRQPSGGQLCLTWRIGIAGSGDQWWSRYNATSHTWSTPVKIVTGAGTESAYFNRICSGPDGIIHAFVCWRATGGANFNQDICHFQSADLGVTWTAIDGAPLSLPISHATSPLVLDTTPTGSGLLNSNGAAVDSNNNPHAAFFLYDANGFTQVNHVWHDETGWHVVPVTSWTYRHDMNVGIVRPVIARPGVVCDQNGHTYIVCRHNVELPQKLWIIDVTPGAEDLTPRILWNTELFYYEPSGIDLLSSLTRNELSLMISAVSDYGFGSGYDNPDNLRTNFSSVPGVMYRLPFDRVSELPT